MQSESFEDNVKHSFRRAKEHTQLLETEIKAIKELVYKQNAQIEFLLSTLKGLLDRPAPSAHLEPKKEVSSGNGGVYSFIHSFNKHSFTGHAPSVQEIQPNKNISSLTTLRQNLLNSFENLPRQELLTFLTIYQLEEDTGGPITYSDLAV